MSPVPASAAAAADARHGPGRLRAGASAPSASGPVFRRIPDRRFHGGDFRVVQLGEPLPFRRREPAFILHAQAHEQGSPAVRHVDDPAHRFEGAVEDGDECEFLLEVAAELR